MDLHDNFATFGAMPEEAEKVGNCAACGVEILEGDSVVEFEDELLCDKYCLYDYMIKEGIAQNRTAEKDVA